MWDVFVAESFNAYSPLWTFFASSDFFTTSTLAAPMLSVQKVGSVARGLLPTFQPSLIFFSKYLSLDFVTFLIVSKKELTDWLTSVIIVLEREIKETQ